MKTSIALKNGAASENSSFQEQLIVANNLINKGGLMATP